MMNKLSPEHITRIEESYNHRIELGFDHDEAVKGVLVMFSEELSESIGEVIKEIANEKVSA